MFDEQADYFIIWKACPKDAKRIKSMTRENITYTMTGNGKQYAL